jgi:hypothetical protein
VLVTIKITFALRAKMRVAQLVRTEELHIDASCAATRSTRHLLRRAQTLAPTSCWQSARAARYDFNFAILSRAS